MSPRTKETESQPFLYKYTDNDLAEPSPEHARHYKLALSRRTRIISHTLVSLLTTLFWLTIVLLVSHPPKTIWSSTTSSPSKSRDPHHNITTNARLQTCGTTPTQARSLGCKYDILLNNWIPAPCYDDEFIQEYTDDESWGAYFDRNMTILLSPTEMSESEFYYTSVRDHINHCAILWKKQFFAFYEQRRAIDTIVVSAGHTDHCAQYLMDVEESKIKEATRVERGFAGCWIRD